MQTNDASPVRVNDLFQGQPLHSIPTILRGETLYSWCARYHRISGSISATSTSQRLFGSKTAGFVVDFPGKIEYLSNVTALILGTSSQIIRDHTLYPLYAAFRPPQTMARIDKLMQGNSVERVKFILGLPASRAATSHPLKFCRSCAHEELVERGIASWWRDHQWPTVWMCPKHCRILESHHTSNGGSKSIAWLTPDSLTNTAHIWLPKISDDHLIALDNLRRLTLEIANRNEFLRPDILRVVFILKLRERSWIRTDGTVDWPALLEAFSTRFGYLETVPGLHFVKGIYGSDFGGLGPMLRGSKGFQHPSKYLLLINLLFDTAEQFFSLYEQHVSTENPALLATRLKRSGADAFNDSINALVVGKAMPLNQVAQLLGTSVQRIISWANRNNVDYNKRPRKTGVEFQQQFIQLLNEGASREYISQTLKVPRRWITAYLARHPVQKEKWRIANLAATIRTRRNELLEILAHHPGANQKAICSIAGNPFQWLKRNDPAWLEENLPFFNIKIRNR